MVHIVNETRFKMVCTYFNKSLFIFPLNKSLFIFQLVDECHCWWTNEPLKAHVAKLYGDFG